MHIPSMLQTHLKRPSILHQSSVETCCQSSCMNIKWTCHICGRMRDDDDISVHTYLLKNLPGAERNIRYCNDSADCYNKAVEKGKTGEI